MGCRLSRFNEELFESAQVVIAAEGDIHRCWVTASEPAWAPFAEVVTALLAMDASQRPEDLTTLRIPGVEMRIPAEGPSEALQAFWEEELSWDEDNPPLRYLEFVRPGTDDGALMPEQAATKWAGSAWRMWVSWLKEEHIRLGWIEQCRAAEASVAAESRTVDWSAAPLSAPHQAVLAELEARARRFDDMIPDEEVTHLVRDRVLLALAAAGVLDGPDEGLRSRALGALGHRTLLAWREAALTLLAWVEHVPALMQDGCAHALSSPVAVDWFRRGPYTGEIVSPMEWLQFHLEHWMKQARTAPGHSDLFSHDYSARVVWRTGVAGLQQLSEAGTPVNELPWQGQTTILAALCTRAKHPAAGAFLGAILAELAPEDWHAWTELGVALSRTVTSSSAHPFRLSPSVPLRREPMAAMARACLARAAELRPSLRGGRLIASIESELGHLGLAGGQPTSPPQALAYGLLANLSPDALVSSIGALPGGLRRQVLTQSVLYTPSIREAARPLFAAALTSVADDPLRRWILARLARSGGRDALLHALLAGLPGAHALEPFLSDARAALA